MGGSRHPGILDPTGVKKIRLNSDVGVVVRAESYPVDFQVSETRQSPAPKAQR